MTTFAEDIWECAQCGCQYGRHDMWFDGICEACHEENEEKEPEDLDN